MNDLKEKILAKRYLQTTEKHNLEKENDRIVIFNWNNPEVIDDYKSIICTSQNTQH